MHSALHVITTLPPNTAYAIYGPNSTSPLVAQTLEASDWPLNIALVADDRAHACGLLRVVMLTLGVGALGGLAGARV